jgi:DNA-binding NtrC family response regulator
MNGEEPSVGSTQTGDVPWRLQGQGARDEALHLVVVWASTPERVAEVAALTRPSLLGRGPARPEDPAPRLRFARQRPGFNQPTPMLEPSRLSRLQVLFTPQGNHAVSFERLGKCPVSHNGKLSDSGLARDGDILSLADAVTFLIELRPKVMSERWATPPYGTTRFGEPDPFGMVGESPYSWLLRRQIATIAQGDEPILVTGASGVGKELVARALHGMGSAASPKFISRNAATLPPSLLDAELFGTQRNYPNPGTPERPGLIGEADGGTLFLDEVGELAAEHQAHLLRFLDHGEYQRLGDARPRTARVRFLAATNRDPSVLKHDFLARFAKRIEVKGLEARLSDVPLCVSAIVAESARRVPCYQRFLQSSVGSDGAESFHARVHPTLLERLLRQDYTAHFRELRRLVMLALEHSEGDHLAISAALESELKSPPADGELGASDIERALAASGGNVTHAARALRLPNRYALYRLMKRLGLAVQEDKE